MSVDKILDLQLPPQDQTELITLFNSSKDSDITVQVIASIALGLDQEVFDRTPDLQKIREQLASIALSEPYLALDSPGTRYLHMATSLESPTFPQNEDGSSIQERLAQKVAEHTSQAQQFKKENKFLAVTTGITFFVPALGAGAAALLTRDVATTSVVDVALLGTVWINYATRIYPLLTDTRNSYKQHQRQAELAQSMQDPDTSLVSYIHAALELF